MELVVTNYVFKEELKNKSSPVYKETEKNFTDEVKSLLCNLFLFLTMKLPPS